MKPDNTKGFVLILILASLFINTHLLFATTRTSTVTGNFSATATWVGGIVPVANDTVVIANGDTVKFTADVTLRHIIINAGGVLDNMGFVFNITEAGTGTLFTIDGVYTGAGLTNFNLNTSTSSNNRMNGSGTITSASISYFGTNTASQIDTTANLTFDMGATGRLKTGVSGLNHMYCYGTITLVSGDLQVGGTWIPSSKLTIGSTGQINITSGDFKIALGSYIYNNGLVTISGDVEVGGLMYWYNYAGSTVNIAGAFLKIYSNANNGKLYANYSGNTVNYNGTGKQRIINPTAPNAGYWNLKCSNSGKKTLSANTIINGDLTIQDAAQLDDSTNFNITLKGNWINTGTDADPFIEQSGTVTFSGATAQTITASPVSGGETFYNLTNSNTSGNLSLNNNITVSNILNMTDGKIILGVNNLLLSTPTAITGYCDTNYVVTDNTGYLQINGITTTPMVFPVGSDTLLYNPATINDDATPANYNVRVCDYVNTAGTCNGGTPITDWGINKTWNINLASGVANATVELQWNSTTDELPGFQPSNCAVNHHNGSNWEAYTFGSYTDKSSGYRSKAESGITSFSPFGVSGGGTPLPIELLSFTGDINTQGQVVLKWTTATETNNDYFTVERVTPSVLRTSPPHPPVGGVGGETLGINFTPIGILKGAGNSNTPINYQHTDPLPTANCQLQSSCILYYRLKQTDYDGKYSYSSIISISLQNSGTFTMYPNPATGTVHLNVPGNKEEALSISVIDKLGRTILSKEENINEGQNTFNLDVSGLSKDVYLLQIATKSGTKEQKQLMIDNSN